MNCIKVNLLSLLSLFIYIVVTILDLVAALFQALQDLLIYVLGLVVVVLVGDFIIFIMQAIQTNKLDGYINNFVIVVAFAIIGIAFAVVFVYLLAFMAIVVAGISTVLSIIFKYTFAYIGKFISFLSDVLYEHCYIPLIEKEEYQPSLIRLTYKNNQENILKYIFVYLLYYVEKIVNYIFKNSKYCGIIFCVVPLVGIFGYQNALCMDIMGMSYIQYLTYFHWIHIILLMIVFIYIGFFGYMMGLDVPENLKIRENVFENIYVID